MNERQDCSSRCYRRGGASMKLLSCTYYSLEPEDIIGALNSFSVEFLFSLGDCPCWQSIRDDSEKRLKAFTSRVSDWLSVVCCLAPYYFFGNYVDSECAAFLVWCTLKSWLSNINDISSDSVFKQLSGRFWNLDLNQLISSLLWSHSVNVDDT